MNADDRAHPQDAADPAPRWHVTAAVATWALPGLGHILIGHAKRGLILMITIGLLWVGGLAIGGIHVIDSRSYWFLCQMLVAPSLAANQIHKQLPLASPDDPTPRNGRTHQPGFGRVHEQGTLYTALAGLLNLLAILDVLYREAEDPRDAGPDRPET